MNVLPSKYLPYELIIMTAQEQQCDCNHEPCKGVHEQVKKNAGYSVTIDLFHNNFPLADSSQNTVN